MKHVKKIETKKGSDENNTVEKSELQQNLVQENQSQNKSTSIRETKDVYGCSIEIM